MHRHDMKKQAVTNIIYSIWIKMLVISYKLILNWYK